MEINKQAINFDADSKLLEFVDKKIEKLGTFYGNIVSADVCLKLVKTGQFKIK